MAFTHGTKSRVYMAQLSLSCAISGFSASHSRDMSEATTLCDGGARYVPGLLEGSVSVEGFFESDQGQTGTDYIHETVRAAHNVNDGAVVTAAPAGLEVGLPAFLMIGNLGSYEVESSVSDVVSLSMEGQANNGADWGYILAPGTAPVAGNDTGDMGSVDHGTDTSNGGVATLHVLGMTANDTAPELDVVVQHSADDSTYVDLVTFSTADAVGTQFVRLPKGTSVDQYIRVHWETNADLDDATFAVAFARR